MPAQKSLLDFISIAESGGNYNAVIGDADATDDLSQYDIDGIYALQRQLLANGEPSDAVGRYQIIQETLKGLVEGFAIDLATMFTRELQDQLGAALLNGRQYAAWASAAIDDAQFAHELSCEWASLPDPDNDGRSHYDGDDAGNHAGQSLTATYAALDAAKALLGT